MSVAAGWYADPTDAARVRWWDGERWTSESRPAPEPALVGAGVGGGVATQAAVQVVSAPAALDVAPAAHTPPAPVSALLGTATGSGAPAVAPAPVDLSPTARSFAPEPLEVDRSRPGSGGPDHRPAAPAPAPAPGYTRPVDSVEPARSGYGAGLGAAAAFAVMSSPNGFGTPADTGHVTYEPPRRHLARTLVVLGAVLAMLAVAAVVGVPRFLDSKAAAAAETAPDVVTHTAPPTFAGAHRSTDSVDPMSGLSSRLTADGAEWVWSQGFHGGTGSTLALGAALGPSDRALAYRALTDHHRAVDLVNQVVADISAGTTDVAGAATEYAPPVGGILWCLPYTSGGNGGGLCVWTNGRDLLVARALPGVSESAAKATLAELAIMAKLATK